MNPERYSLRVEFYGIARARTGVPEVDLELPTPQVDLRQVLAILSDRFPKLSSERLANGGLPDGIKANVNGQRFIHRSSERLVAGETLLLLSADAGG